MNSNIDNNSKPKFYDTTTRNNTELFMSPNNFNPVNDMRLGINSNDLMFELSQKKKSKNKSGSYIDKQFQSNLTGTNNLNDRLQSDIATNMNTNRFDFLLLGKKDNQTMADYWNNTKRVNLDHSHYIKLPNMTNDDNKPSMDYNLMGKETRKPKVDYDVEFRNVNGTAVADYPVNRETLMGIETRKLKSQTYETKYDNQVFPNYGNNSSKFSEIGNDRIDSIFTTPNFGISTKSGRKTDVNIPENNIDINPDYRLDKDLSKTLNFFRGGQSTRDMNKKTLQKIR